MKQYEAAREAYEADAALYARNKGDGFPGMTVCEQHFAEKKDAGAAIISACKAKTDPAPSEIGEYMGFKLLLTYADQQFKVILRGAGSYTVALGDDIFGNIQRLDNQLAGLEKTHCGYRRSCGKRKRNGRPQKGRGAALPAGSDFAGKVITACRFGRRLASWRA